MENKRLFRVQNSDTQLGGVSLGLAEYFSIDITLVRVLFVILFFTPFPAFITYLILWAVLPISNERINVNYSENNNSTLTNTIMEKRNNNGGIVAGAILIILGIIFSFRTYFDINLFHFIGKMWPIFLIGLGVWLIIREKPKQDDFFGNKPEGNEKNSLSENEF